MLTYLSISSTLFFHLVIRGLDQVLGKLLDRLSNEVSMGGT